MNTHKKIAVIAFVIVFVICFVTMLMAFMYADAMAQNILMLSMFLVIVFWIMGAWITHRGLGILVPGVIAYFSAMILVLAITSIPTVANIKNDADYKMQLKQVEETSSLIIETEFVKVYVDAENKKVYSVCDIDGERYIDTKNAVLSEQSEFYQLYNVGLEYKSETTEAITETFLYPPTAFTTTGCEYLLEYVYDGTRYVSRVFIAGIVDYSDKLTNKLFDLYYDSGNTYSVSMVNEYLLFESALSSFTTPVCNVSFNQDEYFYVRFNRYLRETTGGEASEIAEPDVRFIASHLVMSPVVDKVTFYAVGAEVDGVFEASNMVIEITYDNDTSDIAIIKDINAGAIKSII